MGGFSTCFPKAYGMNSFSWANGVGNRDRPCFSPMVLIYSLEKPLFLYLHLTCWYNWATIALMHVSIPSCPWYCAEILHKNYEKLANGCPLSRLHTVTTHRQMRWSIILCLGQKSDCPRTLLLVFCPFTELLLSGSVRSLAMQVCTLCVCWWGNI